MAINQFVRMRYAKPTVNEGPPPTPAPRFKPPKQAGPKGPAPMPEILTDLLKSKRSNFYGD